MGAKTSVMAPERQKRLWFDPPGVQRKVLAPFEVEATEATAPGYRQIFWRLLSRRNPNPVRRSKNPFHFEMVLRNETLHTDIYLVRNPETDQLESIDESDFCT